MPEPTPEQIAARALEIRSTWTLRERRKNLCCQIAAAQWPDWHITQRALGEVVGNADDEVDDEAPA